MVVAWDSAPRAADRPNVVLLIVDDLGYADVGVHGLRQVPTPHIDAIANGGVQFAAGYVTAPVCSPSRAGIMTGRYQQRFGIYDNPPNDSQDPRHGVPLTEATLAERLASLGYRTGLFGKWHLGAAPALRPYVRGFQETLAFLNHGGQRYFGTPERPIRLWRNDRQVVENTYLTFAFAREAVSFIRRNHAVPFFLTASFNALHVPLEAPSSYVARFSGIADPHRRIMAAVLAALDDAIGSILAAIRDEGLERSTLVFFVSDNGGSNAAGNGSLNAPFSGGKRELLEGGIRVPFFVRWPERLPAGVVYRQPVSSLDIHATALAAAGFAARLAKPLDGVDLLPFLTGAAPGAPHQALYWRYEHQELAAEEAVRRGRYKLLRRDREEALFDLLRDPGERTNLIAERPRQASELRRLLAGWAAQLAPKVQ